MLESVDHDDRRYIWTVRAPYPGYRVAIPLSGTTGEAITKSFCGHQKPLDFYLAAAKFWRDAAYFRHFGVPIPKRIFHKRSSATYGVPGVRRIVKNVKNRLASGEVRVSEVPCVLAEVHLMPGADYNRPRRSCSKIYSIKKYGEDEAVRLATRWREAMMVRLALDGDVDADQVPYQFNRAMRSATLTSERDSLAAAPAWVPAPKARSLTAINAIEAVRPPSFNPNFLLDKLIQMLGVTSDRALATLLEVQPGTLSNIRRGKRAVGATLLLSMHEVTGLPTSALRDLMGDRRARHFRMADPTNPIARKQRCTAK